MFVEAFPVRDPNFHEMEMDSEIQKQFEELYVCILCDGGADGHCCYVKATPQFWIRAGSGCLLPTKEPSLTRSACSSLVAQSVFPVFIAGSSPQTWTCSVCLLVLMYLLAAGVALCLLLGASALSLQP